MRGGDHDKKTQGSQTECRLSFGPSMPASSPPAYAHPTSVLFRPHKSIRSNSGSPNPLSGHRFNYLTQHDDPEDTRTT